MRRRAWRLAAPLVVVAVVAAVTAGEAAAQGPQDGGNLPFSNIYRRPALSPYTALGFQGGNPLTGATLGALQSSVQPQMMQQAQLQATLRQQRQIGQIQGQVRQIQRPAGGAIIQTIRSTGHASHFLDMSHFYPSLNAR
jgi:hypothetical protein